MASPDQLELKRLDFVRGYSATALALGENLYRKLRGFVPAPAEPLLEQAEDTAAAIVAPLFAIAQDRAAELLNRVDGKVDIVLGSAIDYSRELHTKNMGSFAAAKESYFGLIQGFVLRAKAALDPAPYLAVAAGLAKRAAGAVAAYTNPDALVAAAASVYDSVAARPPVNKLLVAADPLITAGQSQYAKAHGLLVMQPLYKRLYDTAATLPAKAKDTAIYRKGYPLVAPVADPVLSEWSNSKVIRQLDDHLKPKAA